MSSPRFRRLTVAESRALLRSSRVGRLAFVNGGEVDIEPMHFVLAGRWLFGRTSQGAKLSSLARIPYVAFEVDEVHGLFDWRSVVVHGTYYPQGPGGGPTARRTFARAIRLLGALVPGTLTQSDPVSFRDAVFGVYIDRLEGRAATMPGPARQRRRRGKPGKDSS
jgi:nitroimidazol reductase NimA-like FMN-containing flavoprotein (pyridoxamine 5'-phosphate oxidase superfamily)